MKPIRGKCAICLSPLRGEIEFLIKQGISYSDLALKYHQAFNIVPISMQNKLRAHTKRKHPPLLKIEPVTQNKKHDFSDYAQSLLEVGMDTTLMNPSKVSHSQVIAAHNALINEKKVQGSIDAQKMAFIKFMRGEVVEGEVVDELKLSGAENVPTNTD